MRRTGGPVRDTLDRWRAGHARAEGDPYVSSMLGDRRVDSGRHGFRRRHRARYGEKALAASREALGRMSTA